MSIKKAALFRRVYVDWAQHICIGKFVVVIVVAATAATVRVMSLGLPFPPAFHFWNWLCYLFYSGKFCN